MKIKKKLLITDDHACMLICKFICDGPFCFNFVNSVTLFVLNFCGVILM